MNEDMAFKWRKWNRIIHRDFGYFFFGMTIIYALSGIAINHKHDWDPDYYLKVKEIQIEPNVDLFQLSKDDIKELLKTLKIKDDYRMHYYPDYGNYLKIFVKGGNIDIDLNSRLATIEILKKRPFFFEFNYLHYNPSKWWTWFSDIYAGALMLLAISGLFIIRGKKGITGRGAWMTTIGLLIPILFLILLN